MTEWVEIGGARLACGDCRAVLDTLPNIDAVISDPPYGIKNRSQRGFDKRLLKGIRVERHCWDMIAGDDQEFDPTAWLKFPKVILWGANHYADRLPSSAAWIIWDKRDGVASDDNGDCEMAWSNLRGVSRVHRQLWKGICRAGEENIAIGGKKLHPHQKPVALMEFCIDRCGLKVGDTVLDPFMGSASLGVACIRRGINYIGVEINQDFFDIACRRIEEAYKQADLFIEQPKPEPAVQEALL